MPFQRLPLLALLLLPLLALLLLPGLDQELLLSLPLAMLSPLSLMPLPMNLSLLPFPGLDRLFLKKGVLLATVASFPAASSNA